MAGAVRCPNTSICSTRGPRQCRSTDRDGVSEFEDVKWRRPVAMLINDGTRSDVRGSAYGVQEMYPTGRGNRHSHPGGAVLAATAFLVGDGLLLAVDDVLIDGERLEGIGVAPTIEVQAGSVYGEPGDPQLDRAEAILSGAGVICSVGAGCSSAMASRAQAADVGFTNDRLRTASCCGRFRGNIVS